MKPLKIFAVFFGIVVISAANKKFDRSEIPTDFSHQKKSTVAPVKKGEYLEYRVHYGWLDAGLAKLTVLNQDTQIDGNPVYHIVGDGQTLSVFEWFYKVRDRYETWIDPKTFVPRKFKRRVNEGGYIINRDYYIEPEKGLIHTDKKVTVKTPQDVQDMMSSFYFLRSIDYSQAKPGQIFRCNAFMDYENFPFYVKYLGKEKVKTDMGKFYAHKFVPVVQEGRVFKSESDVSVWITDDHNKVPVMIEAKIIVGSVKMELQNYKNLVAPLNKL
jgi:hypothetical protein